LRPKASTTLALLTLIACAAPAVLPATLAGAAGLLFEALPFVLAASLIERAAHRAGPRTQAVAGWALRLAGCGCGRPAGALGLPAIGLCWLAFGPWIALARTAAALVVLSVARRGRRRAPGSRPREAPDDQCVTGGGPERSDGAADALAGLAFPALLGALGAALAPSLSAHVPWPIAFALGAALGVIVPCVAGSVALATALKSAAPGLAAGALATAGIIAVARQEHVDGEGRDDAGYEPAVLGALAVACAWLVARHGAALVHPRLLPLIGAAAIVCAWLALTMGRSGEPRGRPALTSWIAPALLLGVLVAGSPTPGLPRADATTLGDAYAGQPLRFCGMTRRDARGATTLVRYAITCCRADATPVAIRLDRPIDRPDGTWLEADGVVATDTRGILLRVRTSRVVTTPADPFLYR
jgi:hypothetical protein